VAGYECPPTVEVFDNLKELECTLEWFDTDDPKQGATVTDKMGRPVRLKIERLEALEFEIADIQGC
jgi:hypothetical protein